jgi:DNA transposition AAA+ family ATPase
VCSSDLTAIDAARRRFGARLVVLEAAETWRDSLNAMLGDLLRALNQEPPTSAAARLEKLLDRLQAQRRCLVIDEAHHMGPRGLNLIKTVINRTPGEVVIMGLPVLLKRMEMEAYQEAKQLTLNRLCERVRLGPVEPTDAAKILERLGGVGAAEAKAAGTALARLADGRGALKFCVRVARMAAQEKLAMADEVLKAASKLAAKLSSK